MSSTSVQSGGQEDGTAERAPQAADTAPPQSARGHLSRARMLLTRVLDRYPYPELLPLEQTLWARVALALVALMAVAYVVFFTAYLWATQHAYMTHAEDLGIMDQALWNTLHGAVLHQTICNTVTDTNCLGDISRFAIHFEPIMLPLSLLYAVAPSPKTLQLVQALVVASGVFPTFWIAARRLRSPLAGVVFAAVYLLFPTLQAAVTYDFHAVTLSAAILMFAFYFMLTRNNLGLFIACILALSTKEQMPVTVAMIGLSVMLLQRRWRVGFGLVALAVVWLGIALVAMHIASPIGHSSTASRYTYLGSSPAQAAIYLLTHPISIIKGHVLSADGIYYLRSLLSPVGYLALLSPLTLLIAVPELGINLLSTDAAMHSGLYHYNADIVPVLVFSAIESVALFAAVVGWLARRAEPAVQPLLTRGAASAQALGGWVTQWASAATAARLVMLALTLIVLIFGLHEQRDHGYLPVRAGFEWPQATPHALLANDFLKLIPPNASVSAQSDLVPHLSQRRFIYLYPYRAEQSDYIFLDVTGNLYPYDSAPRTYFQTVEGLLVSGQFHVVAARDGYLLLKKGAGAPLTSADHFGLPSTFYSFTRLATGQPVPHPLDIRYGSAGSAGASLDLVGYDISPSTSPFVSTFINVTTYWRVSGPLNGTYYPQFTWTRPDGSIHPDTDFATIQWLPMDRWQPGQTYMVRSWPLFMSGRELGTMRFGMSVYGTTSPDGIPAPLPASVIGGAGANGTAPALLNNATTGVFADVHVHS